MKCFKYAIEGIICAIKKEKNLVIDLIAVIIVIILGILLSINTIEWIICLILFGLVISSELINTAIERTIDLITQEKHPIAKQAKDIAAGAVLFNAIIAFIIGCIIFIPKIISLFIYLLF